jgi:predicted O-methyltransferase YrrM
MDILTSTKDIERRVREIDDLTSWSPVPLGSILRATSYSYRNWGIGITPENIGWLYGASQEAYSVEWKDTDPSLNALVGKASENAGLGDVNATMNALIGGYASASAHSKNGIISVLDVGAGAGATSMAMLSALGGTIVPNIKLTLIEPSSSRTKAALDAIRKINTAAANIAVVYNLTETEALRQIKPGSIDMAITNAAIHHNSFNFHLGAMSKTLKPNAPLISGDWYDGLSEKPERVYWLLTLLANHSSGHRNAEIEKDVFKRISAGAPLVVPFVEERAAAFRKYFNLDAFSCGLAFANLSEDERKADAAILKFWFEVGKIFAEKGTKSPIYVVEGHERAWRRETAFAENGFCFDRECMEKYRLVTKKRNKGNLNVVSMAKRKAVA